MKTLFVYCIFILLIYYIFYTLQYVVEYFGELYLITDILKRSCEQLGLKYKILANNTIYITHNNKSVTFKKGIKINNDKITEIVDDKHLSTSILRKHSLPAPKNTIHNKIVNKKQIENIVKNNKIKYPLVVKPNDSTGGIKVFINIKDDKTLMYILTKNFLNETISKSRTQKVLLEEYVEGNSFRILCYKDKIIDVVFREDVFVIGNGKNTIEQLVDIKNNKEKPLHNNLISDDYLRTDNYHRNSIPPKNKKIIINIPKMRRGSKRIRVDLNTIHHDNTNMLKQVNKIFGTTLCGIDYIIPDITKSYKTQKSIINEVNASPNFDVHYYADNKNSLEAPKTFLKLYFTIL